MMHANWLKHFVEFLAVNNNSSPNTLKAYESDIRQFLRFGTTSDGVLYSRSRFLSYLSHLKNGCHYSDSTIKRKIVSTRRFLIFLKESGTVRNMQIPKVGMHFKKRTKLPRVMSITQVGKLLHTIRIRHRSGRLSKYARLRDHLIISTLFYTGMRIGEVVSLDTANVDIFSGSVLVRGKGGKERVLYLRNKALLASLKKYLRVRQSFNTPSLALFVNKLGERLTSRSIQAMFRLNLEESAIGARFTPHSLRHTMATTLLERGTNLRALQEILGHSSITSTEIYTHVAPSQVKIALEKLNGINFR